jgi:hypothetical protein
MMTNPVGVSAVSNDWQLSSMASSVDGSGEDEGSQQQQQRLKAAAARKRRKALRAHLVRSLCSLVYEKTKGAASV